MSATMGTSGEGLAGSTRTDVGQRGRHDVGEQPVTLSGRRVAGLALLVILSFAVSVLIYAWVWTSGEDTTPRRFTGAVFVLSLFLPSIITLFGVYWLRGLIRDAIAVAVFIGYFGLVFHFVTEDFGLTSPTANRLMDNFTGLTETIAIFYFSSIAAVEVVKQVWPAGLRAVLPRDEVAPPPEKPEGGHA